nr:MAG TPA: hypothetical protein [Caudoviricetes sp.]
MFNSYHPIDIFIVFWNPLVLNPSVLQIYYSWLYPMWVSSWLEGLFYFFGIKGTN